MRRQIAALKADLGGPHPTRTEALLVDQVAACWLAAKCAEVGAAQAGGASLGQAEVRLRRGRAAPKRLLASVKMLTQLRATMPHGLAPLNPLKLHAGKARRA